MKSFLEKKKKIKIERRNYSNEERRNCQKKKVPKKRRNCSEKESRICSKKGKKNYFKKESRNYSKKGIVRKTKGDIFLIKIKEKLPRQIYLIKLRNGDTV